MAKHILIEIATGTLELVQRQRRDDDAGGNVIEPGPPLAPLHRLGHDPLLVAALGQLVGMEGIPDVLRPQKVEGQQLLRRGGGQLPYPAPPSGRASASRTGWKW